MKINGKNIFIGDLCICTKYSTEIIEEFEDGTYMTRNKFEGKPIKENIVYIKDKHGYFLELQETETLGALAVAMYGAAQRWTSKPLKCEDIYVGNLKHYFSQNELDKEFSLNQLHEIVQKNNDLNI